MRIEKQRPKKSEIHNSKSEMERPMLFVQNLLAPGLQEKLSQYLNGHWVISG